MLRFIFNFIFFGILFFLIWKFFPDAFGKLVQATESVVDFLWGLIQAAWEKLNLVSFGSGSENGAAK